MSNLNVGKWLSGWAVLGVVALGVFVGSGCHSSSPKPQFAELSTGSVTSVGTGATPAGATLTAAPAHPAPNAPTTAPVAPPPATTVSQVVTNPVVPGKPKSAAMEPDMFQVGDTLTITFSDTPVPIQPVEEKVKEDGTITLLQNQIFKVLGKTRGVVEKEIRDRYVPDYYKYMTVLVAHEKTTRWYYVNGEVRSPNRQIYSGRITVLKAIASAGGFTDFAAKTRVQLTRADGRTFKINCKKALENPTLDLEVYPGDTVHVPRSIF